MQFIRNGPQIPDRLLHDHEAGQVVFFCGAGISYPASLPGFKGLVDALFEKVGGVPSQFESTAIKSGQFDTAIGLLERRVGDRVMVRRHLHDILDPDLSAKRALTTHKSILTLSRNKKNQVRVITTNFDRLFEQAKEELGLKCKSDCAPTLDVPKNRWSGLVYIHGLLPDPEEDDALNRLVLSSGDFGLAYLTEGWAARFVTELFRNFTVCFIGYSIDDAVLRYMMDALAADKLQGEDHKEVFAFAQFSKGKEERTTREWKAKNVSPILYKSHSNHYYLHRTIEKWAEDFRDGVQSKERTVIDFGTHDPQRSTKQDDFVGRVIWSLCDSSGLPAKQFADLKPVPSLQWLEPFSERRFDFSDLYRFRVGTVGAVDEKLSFSLISRPSSHELAPWMSLVHSQHDTAGRWDEVMKQLARWLANHLDKPGLIVWFSNNGGVLHPFLLQDLNLRIDDDLAANRLSPEMHTLWRILLSNRAAVSGWDSEVYEWEKRFKAVGPTTTNWLQLKDHLSPKVRFSTKAYFLSSENAVEVQEANQPGDLVDWQVVLSIPHAHYSIEHLEKLENWQELISSHSSEFTTLLFDAMSLMAELGGAEKHSDRSYVYQPSISDHPQNRKFYDWTLLIELSRDSWLAKSERNSEAAKLEAQRWVEIDFPVFKRLAFFAAVNLDEISAELALEWLLTDESWWLWSVETQREAIKLLVHISSRLDGDSKQRLENAILLGPPREMYRVDLRDEKFLQIKDRDVWFRLVKCLTAGTVLGSKAKRTYDHLSDKYPGWEITPDDQDEFPVWMGDGIGLEWRDTTTTPVQTRKLVQWLRENPKEDEWKEDDWRERCKSDFRRCALALAHLANNDEWIENRWNTAINAWSNAELGERAWRCIGSLLSEAPIGVIKNLDYSLSWWIRSLTEVEVSAQEDFFRLANKLLDVHQRGATEPDDDLDAPINHPIGHATEAVLRSWHKQSLEDDQLVQEPYRAFFARICDLDVPTFRYGRHLLARNVVSLFRVDPTWTKEELVPLFYWSASEEEALSAWSGYLGSPRLFEPFVEAVKSDFIEAARHYDQLGIFGKQYANALTAAALKRVDVFKVSEYALAFQEIGSEGLCDAADMVARALDSAGEKRSEYWFNRVVPFFRQIWPKGSDMHTPEVSEKLARVCIASGTEFPNSLAMLGAWLVPVEYPSFVVHLLTLANHCANFPLESLELLNKVVGGTGHPPRELRECLSAIIRQDESLAKDEMYMRLDTYLRTQGL